MSTWAIGDVQGCCAELVLLLDKINFDARRDRLWFVGDLVNRGPQSAATLRLIASLGDAATSVLGNHDLFMLACAAGHGKAHKGDTFEDVLHAPDATALLDWLTLQPLAHFKTARSDGDATARPIFARVRDVVELDAALRDAGRPVMLDFYADWCVSCKEMERYTFADPAVKMKLAGALLLKADVTANSADDRALLKRFQLFGPPGTIFFDAQGREIAEARLIGYQDSVQFQRTLQKAGL